MSIQANKTPLISIIVPVYKSEKYLAKCLDSIRQQIEQNLEIIIVDDGSPDMSPQICDDYVRLDNRIKVIHQQNGGRSSARNAGIAAAKGMWIGFVDSDDWIGPDMYSSLLIAAQTYDADIAICGRIENHEGSIAAIKYKEKNLLTTEEAIYELLKDIEIRSYLCDKLFKKSLFDGIEFPLGRNFEDVAVTYQLFLQSERVAITNSYSYHYVFHGENIVTEGSLNAWLDYWLAAKERFDILAPRYPQFLDILEKDVMRCNLICWELEWDAADNESQRFKRMKATMANFAIEHYQCLYTEGNPRRLDRLRIRLTTNTDTLLFHAINVVDQLFSK